MNNFIAGVIVGVLLAYGYGLLQIAIIWLLWDKKIIGKDKKL